MLLDANAQVNTSSIANGETPLWAACEKGYAEVVTKLIAANADVNEPDRKG